MDLNVKKVFEEGRTCRFWKKKDVSDKLLNSIYELTKFGPTSANCCPLRMVFIKSLKSKERLKPTLAEGNIDKTMTAPVTVIFSFDPMFTKYLPELAPTIPNIQDWFKEEKQRLHVARENATLQAAYFIVAARSHGLDCGPMSGFDPQKVDKTFFGKTGYKSFILCNLGYGDYANMPPREPRLKFDQTCEIL